MIRRNYPVSGDKIIRIWQRADNTTIAIESNLKQLFTMIIVPFRSFWGNVAIYLEQLIIKITKAKLIALNVMQCNKTKEGK